MSTSPSCQRAHVCASSVVVQLGLVPCRALTARDARSFILKGHFGWTPAVLVAASWRYVPTHLRGTLSALYARGRPHWTYFDCSCFETDVVLIGPENTRYLWRFSDKRLDVSQETSISCLKSWGLSYIHVELWTVYQSGLTNLIYHGFLCTHEYSNFMINTWPKYSICEIVGFLFLCKIRLVLIE